MEDKKALLKEKLLKKKLQIKQQDQKVEVDQDQEELFILGNEMNQLQKQTQKIQEDKQVLMQQGQEIQKEIYNDIDDQVYKTKAIPVILKPKILKRTLDRLQGKEIVDLVKKERRYLVEEQIEYEKQVLAKDKNYIQNDVNRINLNLVFVGHVDHGKSTLSGRIIKESNALNEVDLRSFEQAEQNNQVLSNLMDLDEEEQAKGKTIECAKINFQLQNRRFTLFDAPGHKNYIPNMIMGACQCDTAGIIVSAKQGEFESGFEKNGQTKEHILLAIALNVQYFVVIVNKMDLCQWNKERFQYIKEQLTDYLKLFTDQEIQFIPVDAFSGKNVSTKISMSECDWYQGRSLFEVLNEVPQPERESNGIIRIPINDKINNLGQFVFGKIESGNIRENMWISIMPNKIQVKIESIFNSNDERLVWAQSGENVKLKLKGINDDNEIQRGMVICNTDDFCHISYEFYAKIKLFELLKHKNILTEGYSCIMHIHSIQVEVIVDSVECYLNPNTKKYLVSDILKSGQEGIIKMNTSDPICVEKFETLKSLGRFTLRDEDQTIGIGQIYKLKPL